MKEKSVRGEETQEICLCVADDSNFLSPFFADGYPIISEEIAEYFNHNIKRRAKWRSLKIKIASGCIDEQERVIYANAIKNYYTTEHSETKRKLRRNMIASVIMTLIAAAVFTIAIALENSSSAGTVILNMLDVLAWVFMWEAVDKFFFQRHALRVKSLRYQALTEAEVIFEDLNIPKEWSDIKMI